MLSDAEDGPLLLAHRGLWSDELPENSLPALARALAVGADVLEIDVHMTRDGHVVVSHDRDGLRCAGVARAIAEVSLAEIQTWDLRAGCGARLPEPVRMPTLAEVLTAFGGVALNVDVKDSGSAAASQVIEVIAQHGATERVLLTSFETRTLRSIREAGYPGPTGMSRVEAVEALLAPQVWTRRHPPSGRRLQIPLSFSGLRLDLRARIERAHALGLCVDYWVVNDPVQAEALLDMGADGIVTDRADVIAPVFQRHVRCRAYRRRHTQTGV